MKKIRLTEKDLQLMVETAIKQQKSKLSKYESVDDIADWSRTISIVSGDDFKYLNSSRFRVASDSDNEYLAHWDHKLQKGFFDEMSLIPTDVLDSLGIVSDDKDYEYISGLNDVQLSEGEGGDTKNSKIPLCVRGKAAAKAKFDTYPSSYSNGFAVQVCSGKSKGLDGVKKCSGRFCKGKK